MLSSQHLSDIEQEVRQCFIQDDAPEYLSALESGILRICGAGTHPPAEAIQTYGGWRELLRAAHTLKGGAGLAQLYGLSTLCHRIEDLLVAVRDQRLPLLPEIETLLLQSIDEVRRLLNEAATHPALDPTSSLLAELDALLNEIQALPEAGLSPEVMESTGGIDPARLVLESDFPQLLATAQAGLERSEQAAIVLEQLRTSCQMLAEVLNLAWLKASIVEMDVLLNQSQLEGQQVQLFLDDLEQARQQVLAGETPDRWGQPEPSASAPGLAQQSPSSAVEAELLPLQSSAQPVASPQNDAALAEAATAPRSADSSGNAAEPQEISLRVPVTQLNRLNEVVGEMLISYESLKLEHQRLEQSNQDMRRRSRKFYALREQIQDVYDQLLLPLQNASAQNAASPVFPHEAPHEAPHGAHPNAVSQSWLQDGGNGTFDVLQLDRFSGIHSLLQDFQELVTRLEENANDVALCSKGTGESLGQLREQMQGLQNDLVATRLRPFSLLAERFRRPLWNLTQRHHKKVELQVEGAGTLVDRAILDQLYEPLLHLIRNAFDHGIEWPEERERLGKAPQATLKLSAHQSATQTKITLSDDGRGIDFDRVYQKAKQAGLVGSQRPRQKDLTRLLFSSGFSTASQVSELSGRGVGLDVVKAEVEALRGQIEVHSHRDQGTQFVITVPLSLNILSLLTCQSRRANGQTLTLAIPSVQILDFVHIDASNRVETEGKQHLQWRDQTVALFEASELLPLGRAFQSLTALGGRRSLLDQGSSDSPQSSIAIVLDAGEELLAIAVEQLLQEQEMVLKPFDRWLPQPPHLSGCTILPSGEAVPILKPEALPSWLIQVIGARDDGPLLKLEEETDCVRILVVDDSMTARRWLVRSLERLDHQVTACRDGQEAWEQLTTASDYDLVISDVEMPRLDGFKLLSRIRQHPACSMIPVALLTSRQSDRHIEQAKQLGATGYYTKPLGNQALLQELEVLLTGSPVGLMASGADVSGADVNVSPGIPPGVLPGRSARK